MKKRRMKRSPQKASRYRRVVGRLSHSMVALAVVTVGLIFGLTSVGWATNGKALLVGEINTATQKTVLDKAGAGPALELKVGSGPALAVSTTDTVANLSAAMLDGKKAEHFATKDGLDTETAARQDADTKLQQNIDNEAAARQAADSTLQNNINVEVSARAQADAQLKEPDPTGPNGQNAAVDWTKLKSVPAGFVDGDDAVGSSGAANNALVERVELAKPPMHSPEVNTEVVFDTEAFELRAECRQVTTNLPPNFELSSIPIQKLYVVAKEPNVRVWADRYGGSTPTVDSQVHLLGTGESAILAGSDGTSLSSLDPFQYVTYFVDAPSGFLRGDGTATFEFEQSGSFPTFGDTCGFSVTGLGKEVSPTGTDTLGTAANQEPLSAQQIEEKIEEVIPPK
jgi:hypothetical protein